MTIRVSVILLILCHHTVIVIGLGGYQLCKLSKMGVDDIVAGTFFWKGWVTQLGVICPFLYMYTTVKI